MRSSCAARSSARRASRSSFSKHAAAERGTRFEIELNYPEGALVGAGEPILYVTGPLYHLVDLETVLLQKLGPACVAAYNAFAMCADLPKVAFLAMDARHCAGAEMAADDGLCRLGRLEAARREAGAVGFIGCAADATARYFGQEKGLGTMPHALIGYAGSTVRAAEMFREVFPDEPMTVLVDYFGREITRRGRGRAGAFPILPPRAGWRCASTRRAGAIARGSTSRAPTRCSSGTRRNRSAAIAPKQELRYLVGTGVSAAAIWRLRRTLDEAGFPGGQDRRQLGLRPGQMPDDGGRQRADRRDRHRLLPARAVERDLRHRRHHRL